MADVKTINFLGWRKLAVAFSAVLVLVSVVDFFFIDGLRLGLDFTGGSQIEVRYEESPSLDDVRGALTDAGFENYEVQFFGSDQDVLIRIQDAEAAASSEASKVLGDEIVAQLNEANGGGVELARTPDFIGSVVGEELREQGGLGMLVALGIVMIYIALRFQFKFAIAAVVALVHDVVIVVGFFAISGMAFDLTVLAALLATIGYSLNDTIVVADRIRENFRLLRKADPVETINISITQSFSRTLITSLTTIFVLLALFFVGGESIHGFATALLVGVVIGTYSSIYVAANMLVFMNISKEDLMPPQKDEELDSLP